MLRRLGNLLDAALWQVFGPVGWFIAFVTGLGLWGFALTATRPEGFPWWSGWATTAVAAVLMGLGAVGLIARTRARYLFNSSAAGQTHVFSHAGTTSGHTYFACSCGRNFPNIAALSDHQALSRTGATRAASSGAQESRVVVETHPATAGGRGDAFDASVATKDGTEREDELASKGSHGQSKSVAVAKESESPTITRCQYCAYAAQRPEAVAAHVADAHRTPAIQDLRPWYDDPQPWASVPIHYRDEPANGSPREYYPDYPADWKRTLYVSEGTANERAKLYERGVSPYQIRLGPPGGAISFVDRFGRRSQVVASASGVFTPRGSDEAAALATSGLARLPQALAVDLGALLGELKEWDRVHAPPSSEPPTSASSYADIASWERYETKVGAFLQSVTPRLDLLVAEARQGGFADGPPSIPEGSTEAARLSQSIAFLAQTLERLRLTTGALTPEAIFASVSGMTGIQADEALNHWIGKKLTIRSRPLDQANADGRLTVTFRDQYNPVIYMYFDISWKDKFRSLRKGEPISVAGNIERLTPDVIHLTDCELIPEPGS